MPKCEFCGSELEPLGFAEDGSEIWLCPKDCAFERHAGMIRMREEAMSDEEHLADYEAQLGNYIPDEPLRPSHCWTFTSEGTRCPGVVVRTEETRDKPYGNFCPVCGFSLRYHPTLGEGKPLDMAVRYGSQ